MSANERTTQSTGAARLQLGFVSTLCVVGLTAALRPSDGFSSGDAVKVPGLGQRTPIELALLALRTASGLFALWLLVSIIASITNLIRARSSVRAASSTSPVALARQSNEAPNAALPRLFGPGWLQQLLRQAAGGTLALALLAGPASAVTRNPQTGTARTVLAPVASVLAQEKTGVQFAGDVTTGQRWPILPDAAETTSSLSATDPVSTSLSITIPASTSAPTSRPMPTATATATDKQSAAQVSASTSLSSNALPAQTIVEAVNQSEISQPATLEQPTAPKPSGTPSPSTENPAVHVVQPGESFWAIAERHVLANNPHADDHEIARYWEALQALNAHLLPAPGIPDLLFPRTELLLPPITG